MNPTDVMLRGLLARGVDMTEILTKAGLPCMKTVEWIQHALECETCRLALEAVGTLKQENDATLKTMDKLAAMHKDMASTIYLVAALLASIKDPEEREGGNS